MSLGRRIALILLCLSFALGASPVQAKDMSCCKTMHMQDCGSHHKGGCPDHACHQGNCCISGVSAFLSASPITMSYLPPETENPVIVQHFLLSYFIFSQDRPPKYLSQM